MLWLSCPFPSPPTCVMGTHRFPSYSLGSGKVQAFQVVVEKMLGKEAWRRLRICAWYYSRLILVQKMLEGKRPVINILSLNSYVTLTKFRIETVFSVLGSIRKEDVVSLFRWEGCQFPNSNQSEFKTLPSNCLGWEGFPVQAAVVWPFHSSPCLHQSVLPYVKLGSQAGDLPGVLPGR